MKHDKTSGSVARAAVAFVAVAGCMPGIRAAFAQSTPGVTVDVGDCVKLQTPDERLACFDGAVKKNGPAPSAAAPASAAAASSAAAVSSAPPQSASSGAAPPSDHDQSKDKAERDDSLAASTIVAKISALKPTVPNSYQITLDNGQVWSQKYPQFYPLQPGQEVKLTPTRWGEAYRLTCDELKGFIQVQRVR